MVAAITVDVRQVSRSSNSFWNSSGVELLPMSAFRPEVSLCEIEEVYFHLSFWLLRRLLKYLTGT